MKSRRNPYSQKTFWISVVGVLMIGLAPTLPAQDVPTPATGTVELPRSVYDGLIEAGRPSQEQTPPPVAWALGTAEVSLTVDERGAAQITTTVDVEVLEDGWTLIPLLQPGTAVDQAEVDGRAVQLVSTAAGLCWSPKNKGRYGLKLIYRVDGRDSEDGTTLAVPVPAASSIVLQGSIRGSYPDLAVVPAAGREVTRDGDWTRVRATVPSTQAVQLSWHRGVKRGFSMSRASYRGELKAGALRLDGRLSVELFDERPVELRLLPTHVTLKTLTVDGRDAPILARDGYFAAYVQGRGRHELRVALEVKVNDSEGPPTVTAPIPSVPISSFELILPGKKEVTVSPASSVETQADSEGNTTAIAHVPMTKSITVGWTEAVPETVRAETRLNTAIYHAAHAEEGVLYVRAAVDVDITRGETSSLDLRIPSGVQVSEVRSNDVKVVDWRIEPPSGDEDEPVLSLFLDRQLQGTARFEILYDRSLPNADGERLTLPMLWSAQAQRQRGMLALLQSRDLTLEPDEHAELTRVGENQLPAHLREQLGMAVAHTFKYVEQPPSLTVRTERPERRQGRFDVEVDTLVSLGDVTLEGSSTVEVDVKSGTLAELRIDLPADTHLLSLSGPSVRQHQVAEADDGSEVVVEFTQEMDGVFRLEATWERILQEGEPKVAVPIPSVDGSEVEQGRLAVEALSAVEVQPAESTGLTSLDVAELPRRLVLRTTHPILHAYKYVGSRPQLVLGVTRHQVVDVQEAAIDQAHYQTLYTRDGLAVTRAKFTVRNSREQFLKVRLPEDSEIWSAFVDGRPEKPAKTEDDQGLWFLIQIIHQTRDFPVELIYQTPAQPIHGLGTVRGVLPSPKILVTHSRWDVYLPHGVDYRRPRGDLEWIGEAKPVDAESLQKLTQTSSAEAQNLEPLRLVVPTSGVHFAFEKIYANQSVEEIGFQIPYTTGLGSLLSRSGIWLGTALAWLGIGLWTRGRRRLGPALTLFGLLLVAGLAYRFQMSLAPVVVTSVAICTVWLIAKTGGRFKGRWADSPA